MSLSVKSGFYNSINGDRLYDAEDISRIFDGFFTDGIFQRIGDGFSVTATSSVDPQSPMKVTVGTGRGWFNHLWVYNDVQGSLDVYQATPGMYRIDLVYINVNSDSGTRAAKIDILRGTNASANPQRPVYPETTNDKYYTIAEIHVNPGVTSLNQTDIVDVRGTDTPWITSTLGNSLSKGMYGSTFPENPVEGQLFYKVE